MRDLEKVLTPSEMAAYAAQRRLEDEKWCGSTITKRPASGSLGSEPKAKKIALESHWSCNDCTFMNQAGDKCEICGGSSKKGVQQAKWICEKCTLENLALSLACDCCGSMRLVKDPQFWSCNRCTFLNHVGAKNCEQCE